MVSVPDFDHRGLLPPFLGSAIAPNRSPYITTLSEVIAKLGYSINRKRLLEGLLNYRELLYRLEYTEGFQFVDGSFVENIELLQNRSPIDIDVFSFLVRPAKYQNNFSLWLSQGIIEWSDEIVDPEKNKQRFSLDTYALDIDSHAFPRIFKETIYWYSLFSHQRATLAWKGFLLIGLDPQGDANARQAL